MERTFKLKDGTDLGELASKHFDGVTLTIKLADKGATQEETFANLLAASGSHENLRNIFVAGGQALAIQKNVKEYAKELAPKVEAGEITRDEAIQKLQDKASEVPEVTVRGEGTGTRKPSAKTLDKAKDQIVSQAQERLATMTYEERAQAQALLEKLGLAQPAAETPATPAEPAATPKRGNRR